MQESIVRYDLVTFKNLKNKYVTDCKLEVELVIDPAFTASLTDWVGLFKVGWLQSDERILAKYVKELNPDSKESFIFQLDVEKLEVDETEFYHFCYVTSDDRLAGISKVFQFIVDDFEVIDDTSMLTVPNESRCSLVDMKSVDVVKSLNIQGDSSLTTKFKELECENDKLKSQVDELLSEKFVLEEEVKLLKEQQPLPDNNNNSQNDIINSSNNNNSTSIEIVEKLQRDNEKLSERLRELEIENKRIKLDSTRSVLPHQEEVRATAPRSFSFMDSYFTDNNDNNGILNFEAQQNINNINNNAMIPPTSAEIARPIGFSFPNSEYINNNFPAYNNNINVQTYVH
ncbi:hypothetical protein HELRODRAFT_167191 [Helobdella robusta]|uniref:SKICH domain-containing protein n=1 Tax=Helobdella robusta TaxID=6412 RepID=T1EZ44_HELRO|nr:hypothetical protein HELRODRAFT_167191 [Helobdella robusta]ESO10699.1 hypothetical protein HELRODRAFT_167191 [Helobdella robusta]